jgi:hypothetical protein
MHPLSGDLSLFKDQEIEDKLLELNKKYFIAARLGSHEVLTQLLTFITIYKDEMNIRNARKLQQLDDDLGQLINVNK